MGSLQVTTEEMIETRSGDVATREAFKLADLFQKMIIDNKHGSQLIDKFLKESTRFLSDIECLEFSFTKFLDVAQQVADFASGASGSSKDIGACLSRIVGRHRTIQMKLAELTSEMNDGLQKIKTKNIESNTKMSDLNKSHEKRLKKTKSTLKKRGQSLVRLKKASRNKKVEKTPQSQRKELEQSELLLECKQFENEEKEDVERLAIEERSLMKSILAQIESLPKVELAFYQETQNISDILKEAQKIVYEKETEFDFSNGIIYIVENTSHSLPNQPLVSRTCSLISLNSFKGVNSNYTDENSNDLNERTSAVSNLSQDSGISYGFRYSTVRRSPSPFRYSRIAEPSSPTSKERIISKPPLPRRIPTPVLPIIGPKSPSVYECRVAGNRAEKEKVEMEIFQAKKDIENDFPNSIDDYSSSEEDKEVLYYMSGSGQASMINDSPTTGRIDWDEESWSELDEEIDNFDVRKMSFCHPHQ